ncbi:MAG TPA: DUF1573 domain-containing protein [Blastocatellia bacterium]|nr:DUF1573 domain-containing protein [Blastocatellia bacterium]
MSSNLRTRPGLAALLLLVLTITAQSQTAAPGERQPKVSLAATEFNLGEVKQGEPVSHTFIIKNTGTANLEIRDVKPG